MLFVAAFLVSAISSIHHAVSDETTQEFYRSYADDTPDLTMELGSPERSERNTSPKCLGEVVGLLRFVEKPERRRRIADYSRPNPFRVKTSLRTVEPGNDIMEVFGDVLPQLVDQKYVDSESTPELQHLNLQQPDLKRPIDKDEKLADVAELRAPAVEEHRPIKRTNSKSITTQKSVESAPMKDGPIAVQRMMTLEEVIATGEPQSPNIGPEPLATNSDVSANSDTSRPRNIRITRDMQSLKPRIEQCLSIYKRFYLNTAEHGCWSIMHSILALGPDAMIHIGGPRGATHNAVEWLCFNQPCANRQLFVVENNRLIGLEGPGYQGHPGQFLAMLAQINTAKDQSMRVGQSEFTVQDLIETEKQTCHLTNEMTFKLISLMHYLDSDETWTSDDGQEWSIPRLIQWELGQPINGAACGGTHRIMGISYAALKRQERGEEIDGQWWRAQKFMKDYQRYTMTLQNLDGSFSTDWFRRRADEDEKGRKLQTTGHILEWLACTLSEEELSDYRVVKSVAFLTHSLIENRYYDWDKGPRAHAVRALDVYYRRVFGEDLGIPLTPIIQQFTKESPKPRSRGLFKNLRRAQF